MTLARLTPEQFERFRKFIYKESGIQIDEKKVALLSNRIRRRVVAGDFNDFDAYYRFLTSRQGSVELHSFIDAITTNETSFFRTQRHFDWVANEWIAELVAQAKQNGRSKRLRIWSAGCSNGPEPYSIAICLAQNQQRLSGWEIEIVGSDISEQELAMARAGKYRERAMSSVTSVQRRKFFQATDDESWEVIPEIKESVTFRQHNLLKPPFSSGFDCVFIRNVLIYFDKESKRVVITNLLRSLAPGGYLVVGPSEGIYDMLSPLERISPFLYRKPAESKDRG